MSSQLPWILLILADIALKLVAVGLALRLTRYTKGRWAWYALAVAMMLRAGRRVPALRRLFEASTRHPPLSQGIVTLVVSLLFVAALWKLGDYLMENRQHEELLEALSAQTRIENLLVESERRYRTLFEQAGDYAFVLEPGPGGKLVILDANAAALAAHGFTREEIIGQPMSILDPFFDSAHLEERLAAIKSHGEALFQVKHRRKDGTLLDVEVRTTLVHLEGRPVLLASERDITDRIRAEEERQALQAQLHQSQKLESLGSLAGGVAHDMNNVLGAILSLASTLKMKMEPGDPGADSLETIIQACTRGRGVVKSLLYFARKDLQEERVVDLNVLVRDMANLLGYTTLKRFALETELQPGLGWVRCDEGAVSNALMNLCVNSMDAMPEGGVLTLRTGARPEGGVELRVTDTGEGMAPGILAKAMDPFFTTKPVGKGTGLGLSMVFGTMRAHGGHFDLQSQPGRGTAAVLVFPASRVSRPEPALDAQADTAKADRASLDILLVDDDELVRESVLIMLEAMGHRIVPVPGGQEALARLAQGVPVDLVVLDMNMPGLSGAETLTGILALRPALPVLIATGYSDEDVAALAEAHPNVLSLRKPFSPAEVDDRIARLTSPLGGRA